MIAMALDVIFFSLFWSNASYNMAFIYVKTQANKLKIIM